MLALVLIAMTIIVIALVILPLLKGARAAPERALFDRAVYRDQLQEIERDIGRGLITAEEAGVARLEIERRILATVTGPAAIAPMAARGGSVVAASLALLVAAGAGGLYVFLGHPDLPDLPSAGRGAEPRDPDAKAHRDLASSEAHLEEKLKANPNDASGWVLLARTASALNDWEKAGDAYRHALALTDNRPDVGAAYGEMLVLAADGIVTPTAHDTLKAVLARDPDNPAARYYLALADQQAGNTEAAIDAWQKLAGEQAPDSPVRAEIADRITAAAKAAGLPVPPLALAAAAHAPDPAAMAAQTLPPEQQTAMIRGMVEKLAGELKTKPDDLTGWLQLGRSYSVLGDTDKAADAYEHAATLAPKDASIPLSEADTLIAPGKPEMPIPARALAALHRAETLDPENPRVLWYLGLAAAQQHDTATAAGYWHRLQDQLPADSDDRKVVSAALDAIKGK